MRRPSRTLPAVLALALTTACGSTAQMSSSATLGGATGAVGGSTGSVGDSTSDTVSDGSGATSAPGASATRSTGVGSTAVRGGGTTGTVTVPPNPGARTESGPKQPVEVGIAIVKGYDQFYKTIGVKGTFGPQEQQAKAVIDEINREGGLAGHPVKPVYAYVDVQDSRPAPTQEQGICDTFTQDHKVVAAVANQRPNTLAACLNKRGVPLLVTSGENYTQGQLRQWPLVAAPSTLSHEQAVRVLVKRAAAQGYFKATAQDLGPEVKVGYLYYDTDEQTRVAKQVFEPLLKAQGVKTIVAVSLKYPNTADDGSQTIGQIQSSVLTFRQRGVTHVIMLDNGGNVTFNFPTAAEGQGYRPRYAMNTFNAVGIEQAYNGANQLRRMVGVGWNPQFDVAEGQKPKDSPAQARCLSIMKKAGISSEYGIQRSVQFDDCDDLFALQLAANKAGTLQNTALMAALKTLRSVPTAISFSSDFTLQPQFSVSSTVDFHFDDSCRCVTYSGSPQPLS